MKNIFKCLLCPIQSQSQRTQKEPRKRKSGRKRKDKIPNSPESSKTDKNDITMALSQDTGSTSPYGLGDIPYEVGMHQGFGDDEVSMISCSVVAKSHPSLFRGSFDRTTSFTRKQWVVQDTSDAPSVNTDDDFSKIWNESNKEHLDDLSQMWKSNRNLNDPSQTSNEGDRDEDYNFSVRLGGGLCGTRETEDDFLDTDSEHKDQDACTRVSI